MDDPLDSLLNLEEQYHAEGYAVGKQDGARAGQVEGRIFGMQHGFERFAEMGRLHAQAVVWQSRIKDGEARKDGAAASGTIGDFAFFDHISEEGPIDAQTVDALSGGARLKPIARSDLVKKDITKLYWLTKPESISFENNEKGVAGFDDHSSRAHNTAEMIRRNLREDAPQGLRSQEGLEIDIQQPEKKIAAQSSSGVDIEDLDVSRLMARSSRPPQNRG